MRRPGTMRQLVSLLLCTSMLAACVTPPQAPDDVAPTETQDTEHVAEAQEDLAFFPALVIALAGAAIGAAATGAAAYYTVTHQPAPPPCPACPPCPECPSVIVPPPVDP